MASSLQMMTKNQRLFNSFIFILLTFSCTAQSNWPDKHGPNLNGIVPAHSADLPVDWNVKSKKNVVWSTPLKDLGHSTPVVFNDKVWFTSANKSGTKQYLYCIDASSGKILHHKLIYENENPESLENRTNTYATPSCVAEEGAVYAHFGKYGTAKLNSETGDIIWSRRDIKVRHYRGPASSPILYKSLLILTFDGVDRQFTLALDKETGKDVWMIKRSVDYKDLVDGKPKREGDFRKAFNTPNIARIDGKDVLLSVASKAGYGYDPETGKELWIFEHKNMNAAVRPLWISEHGMAIINTGSASATLVGLKLNAESKGDITSKASWTLRRASRYTLPLYYKDHLYQVNHDGNISCINVISGEKVWNKMLPNKFMASPILVGEKIYAFDEFGKCFILKASVKGYELINEINMDEKISASPGVAGNAIFLRTEKTLYKISKK